VEAELLFQEMGRTGMSTYIMGMVGMMVVGMMSGCGDRYDDGVLMTSLIDVSMMNLMLGLVLALTGCLQVWLGRRLRLEGLLAPRTA
jgi:hypothetical protein